MTDDSDGVGDDIYARRDIAMGGLLKGNFELKRNVDSAEKVDSASDTKSEFRRKALESIGGSMVFVEREMLYWEDSNMADKK